MLLQPYVLPVNESAKGCANLYVLSVHTSRRINTCILYNAEVHLRYHKVNIYKFEGDSEMFDL